MLEVNMTQARMPVPMKSLVFPLLAASLVVLFASIAQGQVLTLSKQDLIEYTAQNPFDRFPDGRPKVPDELIDRARELSSEEVWAGLGGKNFNNQFADGFQIVHGGKHLVG